TFLVTVSPSGFGVTLSQYGYGAIHLSQSIDRTLQLLLPPSGHVCGSKDCVGRNRRNRPMSEAAASTLFPPCQSQCCQRGKPQPPSTTITVALCATNGWCYAVLYSSLCELPLQPCCKKWVRLQSTWACKYENTSHHITQLLNSIGGGAFFSVAAKNPFMWAATAPHLNPFATTAA
ncbi:unnamed protein product, partial [Ectocarpus sp. 13 AM-2016]